MFFFFLFVFFFFFFFQAEDGIRDLVRSRGLGDVYKRQIQRPVVNPIIGNGSVLIIQRLGPEVAPGVRGKVPGHVFLGAVAAGQPGVQIVGVHLQRVTAPNLSLIHICRCRRAI